MISNRERELWRELRGRDFLVALLIMVILILIYLLVGGFKLDVFQTLLLDVIANLIPVSLAFVVSYAFLRRIQQLKSEQEMEELASRISSNIASMLPALTQGFSLEKFNVNAAKYWA